MGGIRGELVFCPYCQDRYAVVRGILDDHEISISRNQYPKYKVCEGSGMIVDINFYPREWAK